MRTASITWLSGLKKALNIALCCRRVMLKTTFYKVGCKKTGNYTKKPGLCLAAWCFTSDILITPELRLDLFMIKDEFLFSYQSSDFCFSSIVDCSVSYPLISLHAHMWNKYLLYSTKYFTGFLCFSQVPQITSFNCSCTSTCFYTP